jgi:hypothetical protein
MAREEKYKLEEMGKESITRLRKMTGQRPCYKDVNRNVKGTHEA